MLFLDEVTECREGFARSKATVGPDHPFVDDRGEVEAVALVEILAQGTAALRGPGAGKEGESPGIGYLGGIKQLTITGRPRSGQTLSVESRRACVLGPVAVVESRVLVGDSCLASGSLKIWRESGESLPPAPARSRAFPTKSDHSGLEMVGTDCGSPIHHAVLGGALWIEPTRLGNEAAGEFCFEESFLGFRGHFPGYPILPGIIMVKTALIVCERIVQHPLDLVEIERAKFNGRVFPGQVVRTNVRLTARDAQRCSVRTKLACAGNVVASLQMSTTASPAGRAQGAGH